MTCEACGGRRHVEDRGAWKPCACLLRERSVRLWREARVPSRWDPWTWGAFHERFRTAPAIGGLVSRLSAGRLGESSALIVGTRSAREVAAALLLRDAIHRGLAAEVLDLPRLIDHEFQRSEERGAPTGDPHGKAVVALRLGDEPRHARNRHSLEKLLRVRADERLATILLFEHEDVSGAYESADVARVVRSWGEPIRVERAR